MQYICTKEFGWKFINIIAKSYVLLLPLKLYFSLNISCLKFIHQILKVEAAEPMLLFIIQLFILHSL